jgi:hypothetical protein
MQATHSRQTQSAANQSSTQPGALARGGERIHRFILAVLFTGMIVALALVVANRGPVLAEQTISRLSYPITQAVEFTTHPIAHR